MAKKKHRKKGKASAAAAPRKGKKRTIRKAGAKRRGGRVSGVGAASSRRGKRRPAAVVVKTKRRGQQLHVRVGAAGEGSGIGAVMKPDVLGLIGGAALGSVVMGAADGYQAVQLVKGETKPENFTGGGNFSPTVAVAVGAACLYAGKSMKKPVLTQVGIGMIAAGTTTFVSRQVGVKAAEYMIGDDKQKVAVLEELRKRQSAQIDQAVTDAMKAATKISGVGADWNRTVGSDVTRTVSGADDAPSANPFVEGVGETVFAPSRIGQTKVITTDTPEMNRLLALMAENPDGVSGVGADVPGTVGASWNPYLYGMPQDGVGAPGPVPGDPYATGTMLYGVGNIQTDHGAFIAGEMPTGFNIR